MSEAVVVQTGEVIEQQWGDVDVQIATAKRFPRSIKTFIERVTTMATITPDVAKSCFYAIPRKEKGVQKMIKGPSARLAEIVASAWGNLRAEGRTVGEDDKFVTSRAVSWDLETNVAIAFEARRRITNSEGRRFNDDMIAVTANAATSIALRNAIFKSVPSSYWRPIYDLCLKVSVGDAKSLDVRRKDAVAHFGALGITSERVLATLEKRAIEDVDASDIETLIGLANAIKDGETTIEDAFPAPAIREVQRKSEPAKAETKPAEGASAGQSLVDALEKPKSEAAPAPPEPEPAKANGHGYSPDATYHLAKVHQPNPAKAYHILETAEGVTLHTWSTTVISGAKAALAACIPVRMVAELVDFKTAPWRVVRLESIEGREPGSDDE